MSGQIAFCLGLFILGLIALAVAMMISFPGRRP
jgi:hypothetical protein